MKFNLTRRFALLALTSITAVSIVSAALLSRSLAERTIHHDADVFQSFVRAAIPASASTAYFSDPQDAAAAAAMQQHFSEIVSLRDVVHANVYNAQRKVLWSTKPDMIGKVLPINPELDEALEGELEVESSILEGRHYLKPEHIYLADISQDFVETYVPIWDAEQKNVLGVLEVYRTPRALFQMTWALIRGVWLSAIIGGAFLFGVLYWVVRRADRLIRQQQRQIVEKETLAAVGEMSSAVAHSIRNPLASIRSSAELAQDGNSGVASVMDDIIAEVDRIASWIRDLLVYGQPSTQQANRVDLADAINSSLLAYAREFERRKVVVHNDARATLNVLGDSSLYAQVFNSLFSNAIEAMPSGGDLHIQAQSLSNGKRIEVTVRDTGEGMSPAQVEKAFQPFQTTKKAGLGIGLPLVRRVIERFGGKVEIESTQGAGTTVRLNLPTR